MLYFTYAVNSLLMIALPIGLGLYVARRLRVRWSLFGIGALTFLASQAVHLPVNWGLTALFAQKILPAPPAAWRLPFNAAVLGLTAGLSEETARYIAYRWWIKSARTWREALMFGAGHGGIEAIVFGVLAGASFINLAMLRNANLAAFPIPAEQLPALKEQIAAYWSSPWYASLLGAVERVSALCIHLSMAVVVLQAVTRRNLAWLGAAVLWHAASDAVAVLVVGTWGIYWTEAVVGGFALASLAVLFALIRAGGEAPPGAEMVPTPVTPTVLPGTDAHADLRRELDETRFAREN